MNVRVPMVILAVFALSCSSPVQDNFVSESNAPGAKSDGAQASDLDWANQFFLTQIYDERWNPSGIENDLDSNSCGPASLAMLMRERETLPEHLGGQKAIDYARALMHPNYPEFDPETLPENATLYVEDGLLFIEDNTRPVYFDLINEASSIPQGVIHGGGEPVFGYSWDELDAFLELHGSVIAYGHITQSWRQRFSGDYGTFGVGTIPHFIALFPTSNGEGFVVSDPMHRGGAAVMTQGELQTFFKSPVSVYDTTIRLISWPRTEEPIK